MLNQMPMSKPSPHSVLLYATGLQNSLLKQEQYTFIKIHNSSTELNTTLMNLCIYTLQELCDVRGTAYDTTR